LGSVVKKCHFQILCFVSDYDFRSDGVVVACDWFKRRVVLVVAPFVELSLNQLATVGVCVERLSVVEVADSKSADYFSSDSVVSISEKIY
jgi:hypothetical protein